MQYRIDQLYVRNNKPFHIFFSEIPYSSNDLSVRIYPFLKVVSTFQYVLDNDTTL